MLDRIDTFLPWQQELWNQMITNPNPAHAYLFYGKKGIGKSLFAKLLADYWLCLAPKDGAPCHQCKSCHLLASSGAHPDIFKLVPQDSEFIRVDQVRGLIDFINQTPQLSACKIVIIEPAEALNINAANALLKSLEEPAGNTRIILVSHQAGQLLPTIKSRCIQQRCLSPTMDQAILWMQQQLPDIDIKHLHQLWLLAGKAPLYGLDIQQQGVLQWRSKVVEDIKMLLKHQKIPSQVADQWGDIPLLLLFDWFYSWLHEIMRYQLTGALDTFEMSDMAKVLGYLAQKTSTKKITEMQSWVIIQRQKLLAKANFNRVLLLEALLIHWIKLLTTE